MPTMPLAVLKTKRNLKSLHPYDLLRVSIIHIVQSHAGMFRRMLQSNEHGRAT
jgi:hypothetical protein